MSKIPLYLYVAQNNPRGAANIISKFNMGNAQNYDELARGLKHIMATKGEQGFIEIAKIHPDRKLILDVEALTTTETKSNCSGSCNGCTNFSGANGETTSIDKSNIRFATKEDLDKYEIEKKVAEIEKKLNKEDIAKEVKNILNKSNNFITSNLPTIAIIAGVAFLYIKLKK